MNRVLFYSLCTLTVLSISLGGYSIAAQELETKEYSKETVDTYNELFAEAYRSARRTSAPEDDLVLANLLFQSANQLTEETEIREFFILKTIELAGAFERSSDVARQAGNAYLEMQEDEFDHVSQNTYLVAFRDGFRASRGDDRSAAAKLYYQALVEIAKKRESKDEILPAIKLYEEAIAVSRNTRNINVSAVRERIEKLRANMQASEELLNLKMKLIQNPRDRDALERLINTYVFERRDRKAGMAYAPYLINSVDQENMLSLLNPMDQLDAEASKKLALWLLKQADEMDGIGRANAMNDALMAYNHFLEVYPKKDVNFIKARVDRNKLQEALANAVVKPTGPLK